MCQSSFADLTYTSKKKLTRKERFLAEVDQLLPWPLRRHAFPATADEVQVTLNGAQAGTTR